MSATDIQDLSQIDGTRGSGPTDAVGSVSSFTEPYNPARAQEHVRGRVAILLIIALLVMVATLSLVGLAGAQACWDHPGHCAAIKGSMEAIKLVLDTGLTAIVGLVGAVTGFYFGAKSGVAADSAG
ncbi:MAG: hypothetical protein Q8J89_09070 [Caulobacter sp.]|nr:hypothetical protein [Caulobacter sp.]